MSKSSNNYRTICRKFGMLFEIFLFHLALHFPIQCKILRVRDNYVAKFVLVDSDSRIKSNCIRNITKFNTPQECSYECIKNKDCISINRHRDLGICELLAVSKFNESGLLQRDLNWVHYETDDDEKNIGLLCSDLSPCQPYQVCEMTFECSPAFICRCRDGFTGDNCTDYTGPGTERSNPVSSCFLLMSKYKSIPDGDYWIKGQDKPTKCERTVNGGYSLWSTFTECNFHPCGGYGTQERFRTCTNPSPKGGGMLCDHIGPQKEVKSCYVKCPACSTYLFSSDVFRVSRNYLFKTFGRMLKSFRVGLELKVDFEMKQLSGNIFHFTTGGNHGRVGERVPGLWITRREHEIELLIDSYIGSRATYRHLETREISLFQNWVFIEISQKQLDGIYYYRIKLNGEKIHETINPTPLDFDNMKLYLSDPWHPPFFGWIRKMYIEGACE